MHVATQRAPCQVHNNDLIVSLRHDVGEGDGTKLGKVSLRTRAPRIFVCVCRATTARQAQVVIKVADIAKMKPGVKTEPTWCGRRVFTLASTNRAARRRAARAGTVLGKPGAGSGWRRRTTARRRCCRTR